MNWRSVRQGRRALKYSITLCGAKPLRVMKFTLLVRCTLLWAAPLLEAPKTRAQTALPEFVFAGASLKNRLGGKGGVCAV